MANKTYHWGTGRRKTAIARVRLKAGSGEIKINERTAEDYVGNRRTLTKMLTSPLVAVQEEGKLDVIVNVKGGGISSQVGAIRHGISRALLEVNDEYRSTLKSLGFLTRDARVKERKKPGQKRARKKFQFSKR
ncbi:MAG: 30S ribosomal protein S9 [Candidatus Sericytochromatia bacterium]